MNDFIKDLENFLLEEKNKANGENVFLNPPKEDTDIKFILKTMRNKALQQSVSLPSVVAQVERIESILDNPVNVDALLPLVQELKNRFNDELLTKNFLPVPDQMVKIYEDSEGVFGQSVCTKFPSVLFDIDEAGKCLATGRYTACAFHLMRVFEHGIHELAKSLSVKLNESSGWLDHLNNQIAPAIEKLPDNTPELKSKKKLMQQAKSYLHGIRLGWRNDTMHPKATYTEEEATMLFNLTRVFMNHLPDIV